MVTRPHDPCLHTGRNLTRLQPDLPHTGAGNHNPFILPLATPENHRLCRLPLSFVCHPVCLCVILFCSVCHPVCLCVILSVCVSSCLSVCHPVCLCVNLSVCVSSCLSVCHPVGCLCVILFVCVSSCSVLCVILFVSVSSCLSVCHPVCVSCRFCACSLILPLRLIGHLIQNIRCVSLCHPVGLCVCSFVRLLLWLISKLWTENVQRTSVTGRLEGRRGGGEVELHVLECRLTYKGQTVTNAEARFNVTLRPQKP